MNINKTGAYEWDDSAGEGTPITPDNLLDHWNLNGGKRELTPANYLDLQTLTQMHLIFKN